MIEHTKRMLNNMLLLITQYRSGNMGLLNLINSLQGCLSALEEPLPKSFYDAYYSQFINLDTISALDREGKEGDAIIESLTAIENILSDYIFNN
jgi:hypothetical protein